MSRVVLLVGALALASCADDAARSRCAAVPDGDRFELVHASLWEVVGAADDPWAALRPSDLACPADAAQAEDFAGRLTWGVDTTSCGHSTARQPLLEDACAGETLFVWVWREALTGPEGATSTLAVQLGDERVIERVTPIPAPPELLAITATFGGDHQAGEPIWFHVRNHGANSYQVIEVARCVGACTIPP
ncbi:MAG: hypothetical protein IT385_16700 [Deltaproteobacteria bacterium]|nr:hypothetical protein [Deltaproteobacteria bacterium]